MRLRLRCAPWACAAFVAVLLVVQAWVSPSGVLAQKVGGTLRIAIIGEPPTLDPHWSPATITEIIAGHYLEGLYARDRNYQPIPMLAESHSVGAGG